MIQEALNQQTFHQFKAYAEQQFPGNPEQVPFFYILVTTKFPEAYSELRAGILRTYLII